MSDIDTTIEKLQALREDLSNEFQKDSPRKSITINLIEALENAVKRFKDDPSEDNLKELQTSLRKFNAMASREQESIQQILNGYYNALTLIHKNDPAVPAMLSLSDKLLGSQTDLTDALEIADNLCSVNFSSLDLPDLKPQQYSLAKTKKHIDQAREEPGNVLFKKAGYGEIRSSELNALFPRGNKMLLLQHLETLQRLEPYIQMIENFKGDIIPLRNLTAQSEVVSAAIASSISNTLNTKYGLKNIQQILADLQADLLNIEKSVPGSEVELNAIHDYIGLVNRILAKPITTTELNKLDTYIENILEALETFPNELQYQSLDLKTIEINVFPAYADKLRHFHSMPKIANELNWLKELVEQTMDSTNPSYAQAIALIRKFENALSKPEAITGLNQELQKLFNQEFILEIDLDDKEKLINSLKETKKIMRDLYTAVTGNMDSADLDIEIRGIVAQIEILQNGGTQFTAAELEHLRNLELHLENLATLDNPEKIQACHDPEAVKRHCNKLREIAAEIETPLTAFYHHTATISNNVLSMDPKANAVRRNVIPNLEKLEFELIENFDPENPSYYESLELLEEISDAANQAQLDPSSVNLAKLSGLNNELQNLLLKDFQVDLTDSDTAEIVRQLEELEDTFNEFNKRITSSDNSKNIYDILSLIESQKKIMQQQKSTFTAEELGLLIELDSIAKAFARLDLAVLSEYDIDAEDVDPASMQDLCERLESIADEALDTSLSEIQSLTIDLNDDIADISADPNVDKHEKPSKKKFSAPITMPKPNENLEEILPAIKLVSPLHKQIESHILAYEKSGRNSPEMVAVIASLKQNLIAMADAISAANNTQNLTAADVSKLLQQPITAILKNCHSLENANDAKDLAYQLNFHFDRVVKNAENDPLAVTNKSILRQAPDREIHDKIDPASTETVTSRVKRSSTGKAPSR